MLPFDSQIRGTSNALLIAGRNAASRQEATVVISEIHSQSGNEYTHRQPVVAAFPESYLLAPRCRVLLEQLTGLQLVKKYHAFHGTRRFITAITRVRHLSLSWASPIQSIYPHPISWRSILILSTHLRLGLPSLPFLYKISNIRILTNFKGEAFDAVITFLATPLILHLFCTLAGYALLFDMSVFLNPYLTNCFLS